MANPHTTIAAPAAARHSLASALPRGLAGLLLLLALLAVSPRALAVESRAALVIGNANDPTAPLGNVQNDATMAAKVLQRAGFKVDLRLNANQRQMQEAICSFGGQLRNDAVGLFYFAGHGPPGQMPTSSTATFTPAGGSLQNPSGTISVNFATRDVTLSNLGFSVEGLAFSGLAGSARYSDKVASGAFTGNYTAGTCTGCTAFAPQSSAFGGNFVGRAAEGLLFSTFLFTGTGTVSGLQLFQRP